MIDKVQQGIEIEFGTSLSTNNTLYRPRVAAKGVYTDYTEFKEIFNKLTTPIDINKNNKDNNSLLSVTSAFDNNTEIEEENNF